MLELSSMGLVLLPGFGHAKGPLRFSGPGMVWGVTRVASMSWSLFFWQGFA
jgi:hypothetical protein